MNDINQIRLLFFCSFMLVCTMACKSDKASNTTPQIGNDQHQTTALQAEKENAVNDIDKSYTDSKIVEAPTTSKKELQSQRSTEQPNSEVSEKKVEIVQSKPTSKKSKKKVRKFAEMTFDSVVHRLPDVVEGDHFKNEFVFTNSGEVPLTIKGASSSCGCTTPSFSFLDIEPGETSTIGVDYFSVNKDGPQEAEIVIKANTYPESTTLKMLFDVLPQEEKPQVKTDSLPD